MRTLDHDTEQRGRLAADREENRNAESGLHATKSFFVTDVSINSIGLIKQVQSVEETT